MVKWFLAGCIVLCAVSSAAFAEDIDETMANFYNGFADIIERNMNSPDTCVAESEKFIQDNQEALAKMRQAQEEGKRRGMSGQHSAVSEEEMNKALEALAKSKGVRATDRWTNAFETFSMDHPNHAAKIGEFIELYSKKR